MHVKCRCTFRCKARNLSRLKNVPHKNTTHYLINKNKTSSCHYEGILCYSCGSLFNVNAPKCDDFDRFNQSQRARCRPGEGCLLYTWQKSANEKGVYTSTLFSPIKDCIVYSFKHEKIIYHRQ